MMLIFYAIRLFMGLLILAVLLGAVLFLVGLIVRKKKIILIGAPGALLVAIWLIMASWGPNPQDEFDRLFGVGNRGAASAIQTVKPTFMDGHFISFHMSLEDFKMRIQPQFTEMGFAKPPNLLLGQPLPKGWPAEVETATSAWHREIGHDDVYVLYLPSEEKAYASVRYDPGW